MIVSCESCKSRYKLDDSKITGRGAKITCPKCKHVFVVLAPPPAVADTPRPTPQPQGDGGAWADEEPTRVGREQAAAAEAAEASQPGPVVPPEHEVVRPRSAPAGEAAPPTKEAITARAAALDFRQVGVAAWKVKVRIGLVYDFSDIKTLRKYIQDGRVTPADVISHDGKTWQPIGDIPDLDLFFIEAHERLSREFAARPAPPRQEGPAPADLGNVAAELAAAAAAELDGKGKVGPTYQDPFEAMKKRQRERGSGPSAPPPKAAGSGSSGLLPGIAVALLILIGVGAWWYFGRTPTPAPAPPVAAAKPETPAAPTAKDREWTPVPPVAPRGAEGVTEAPQARPDDCPEGFQYLAAVKGCVAVRGAPPAGGAPPPPGGASGKATAAANSGQAVREETPEQVGDSAMKTQNYETAVIAYGKAVAAGSTTAVIKLGEAQLRVGDLAAAQATLTKAASSNKRAYKFLGELKEKMGDVAGAKAAYEAYCKAFPKDTAARSHLDSLGG